MDLRDVSYFSIFDSNKIIYYEMNFDEINSKELMEKTNDSISIYKEMPLFVSKKYSNQGADIIIALLAKKDSNEIFVENAFSQFISALDKFVKNWSISRIEQKYDQIVFLANEFIYNGIILQDDSAVLEKRLQKRTFESVSGMKVNKGFASFLGKAAKSLKNGLK